MRNFVTRDGVARIDHEDRKSKPVEMQCLVLSLIYGVDRVWNHGMDTCLPVRLPGASALPLVLMSQELAYSRAVRARHLVRLSWFSFMTHNGARVKAPASVQHASEGQPRTANHLENRQMRQWPRDNNKSLHWGTPSRRHLIPRKKNRHIRVSLKLSLK